MNRWYIAFLIYWIAVCLLLALRPKMLFQPDKTYKKWSVHRRDDSSIFSIAFLFPVIGILSYYMAALVSVLLA